MLIDRDAQISKNAFNYKVICVNKIDYILKNYENNENDIRSDVEHHIYKRFNNKPISFEQVLRNDIIVFDKYKISADFYENEL